MYKKVLIAEDIDSISISVSQTLNQLGITNIDTVKYCDDAVLKVKKALADGIPYDLFISDLSFESDHRAVKIKNGEEAIGTIKLLQPNLKIIVYSVEDKSFRVKSLLESGIINGFVHKGRNSIEQLKIAINKTHDDDSIFLSPEMEYILKDKNTREIDEVDIQIIKQLALGVSQDEIEFRFKELGITPNSKSTIEKRIGKLKDYFKANNSVHLIAIAKDLGIA
ncbi:response regulator [Flavobacterium sp.]|uniref:DNA-binding response regulator n=1 Tax=Flavobacterium sp. TaxID=239 RepID=UPI002487C8AD|nr:response regulator [Flavobacterium sp.]MDI1315784.1 response regulator [Flavobacterium sp.]